jgi:23S rRNA (guanosine2251-2'-O)-methyltransferase
MSEWIVGYHAVLGVLSSDRRAEMVWLQQGRRDHRIQDLRSAARRAGVATRWVPKRRLDELAGATPHNGCAVRCAPMVLVTLDEVVADPGRPGRLLLLDTVTDPHNLGAAIRSAAAFAVDGLIVAGPSAPPLGGAAERAAAGHMATVPLVRVTVAADALVALRDHNYWILGADMRGAPLAEVRSSDRWVLCIGAEEKGLRAKTRSAVDEFIRIPTADGVESLNLSVATGVLLYHLCAIWGGEGTRG